MIGPVESHQTRGTRSTSRFHRARETGTRRRSSNASSFRRSPDSIPTSSPSAPAKTPDRVVRQIEPRADLGRRSEPRPCDPPARSLGHRYPVRLPVRVMSDEPTVSARSAPAERLDLSPRAKPLTKTLEYGGEGTQSALAESTLLPSRPLGTRPISSKRPGYSRHEPRSPTPESGLLARTGTPSDAVADARYVQSVSQSYVPLYTQ